MNEFHLASTGSRVERGTLQVDRTLVEFVENEVITNTDLDAATVWSALETLASEFGPRNRRLLERREELQRQIDDWYDANGTDPDPAFLAEIGYSVAAPDPFSIETDGVDDEIARIAGPQLVVPADNARYALNAANARWGSLYDALYGTDVLGDPPPPGPYDPQRGARVVEWAKQFLDSAAPLNQGSHQSVVGYRVRNGKLVADLDMGSATMLSPSAELVGWNGDPEAPSTLVVRHHGLLLELVIDRSHHVGAEDRAGVSDVRLESAVTTIIDLEDSVAAVDGEDKVVGYRNWLGLLRRTLTAEVSKAGRTATRRLHGDRQLTTAQGSLPMRMTSVLMVRNVGHLMTTPAVVDEHGREIPEGLLDALVTVLCAREDALGRSDHPNSATGSIYVVKPKMHGPEEVAFAVDVFTFIERALGLPENTVKLGIMDEERRTSVNLSACIWAARRRVAFINTGFLDRTGDEIHTCMRAGPVMRKADMKTSTWLPAYEDWNIRTGVECGLIGRAQIGKGMWAAPDLMADMLDQKIAHPLAGASCAWVPSPTAATLHATHYHRVDVAQRQRDLAGRLDECQARAELGSLLVAPVVARPDWSDDERLAELRNNLQGILGYVVRWVDQGVGCSKVPDIGDVGLMEDRATCRISSQHVANWLAHGVVSIDEVDDALQAVAALVDRQNADDPTYRPMAPNLDGVAFRAARELVVAGGSQPSGYTEPILHRYRHERKKEAGS
ncbi:malate synthase [Ilumatobacter fluminis]|uniref:Malate synthase G n=1 Tax=Ilumatobacter fluminis TaxID=467091 RepID=A0A4R7HXS1_9ACTN|nr:malate synthase G [Ilumatobacter fluminis]TDT14923.1 malate synthase [Ilumatobacter fluminis]